MPNHNIPHARVVVDELRRLADRIEAELPPEPRRPADDPDDEPDDPPHLRLLRSTGVTAAAIALACADYPLATLLHLN